MESRDKLKQLYLQCHNPYGNQICDGDLTWGVPIHKAAWLFGHLVLWDHVAN